MEVRRVEYLPLNKRIALLIAQETLNKILGGQGLLHIGWIHFEEWEQAKANDAGSETARAEQSDQHFWFKSDDQCQRPGEEYIVHVSLNHHKANLEIGLKTNTWNGHAKLVLNGNTVMVGEWVIQGIDSFNKPPYLHNCQAMKLWLEKKFDGAWVWEQLGIQAVDCFNLWQRQP